MSVTITSFIIAIVSFFPAASQNAKVKAMYMYNFIRNMDWEEEKSSDTYTVAVLGDVNVLDQLKEYTNGKKVNAKNIEVINYTSDTPMSDIHILFLSNLLSDQLDQFNKLAIPHSVVVVTEAPGLSKKGAAINFVVEKNQLKYEINSSTLSQVKVNASRNIINSALAVN